MANESISMNDRHTAGLGPAHSGYMYQDLVTAYFMAQALIDQIDLTVDKKSFEGDIFDDLRIGSIRRMQLKSSLSSSAPFELADLSTKRRNARIDELLFAAKADGFSSPEYRLSATWLHPTDPDLEGIISPVNGEISFQGGASALFRLEAVPLISGSAAKLNQHLSSFSAEEILAFCDRFRLELECPMASLDLDMPGTLENILLDTLRSRIGVGIFPNQHLQLVDTAAHLVYLATLARANQKTIQPADTIQRLRLRTDYGRIAQMFPVDESLLVERNTVLERLSAFVAERPISIVMGEPGAGKSWLLTELSDRWKDDGIVAIRHYCYLEPTDREVQHRVTSRVMFGNLSAELLELRPDLKAGSNPLFAATAHTFQSLLANIPSDEELCVVVDGIDHVSRVAHQSTSLAPEDVDVVQQLALLKLPPNVHLVIGSQPGTHLHLLENDDNVFALPRWQIDDVSMLVDKIGLTQTLLQSGHSDQVTELVRQIDLRADGNPLYATYITRELRLRAEHGDGIDLKRLVDEIPFRLGDLTRYYNYLFRRIEPDQAVWVAETLALLDFGVSKTDLAEIYPADAHRLSRALEVLRPILERASAQGGFRIYHESFRRFVVDKLVAEGASIRSRLQPVCAWLEQSGFFDDSRAFRFLIPTLRRAGLDAEVLNRITSTFMQDSLRSGHPSIAIAYNLVVAAEVAAKTQDWGALSRINEIQRANATYVSERIGDVAMYGRAFAALRGAESLSERLLFEGRPTFFYEPGLLLCEACDRAGAVPPWREYMRLPASELNNSFVQTQVALAFFRGLARLSGRDGAIALLLEWSEVHPDRGGLLHGAVDCLESIFGDEILIYLLSLAVPGSLRIVLLTEALRHAKKVGDENGFNSYIQELLALSPDLPTRSRAVKMGLSLSAAGGYPAPENYALEDIYAQGYDSDLEDWMATLTMAARAPGTILSSERERVAGEGWYRYWLQFVVAIAEAEALYSADKAAGKAAAVKAFDLLVEDTRRFAGTPRACDLYNVQTTIFDSIRDGLGLLDQDPLAFQEVLPKLVKISDDTTSSLHNEESGPLTTEGLFNVLQDFVENPALAELILPVLQTQRKDRIENRAYYTSLSVQELQLCHIYSGLSRREEAESHWARACSLLSGYGQRKDVTFSELLEGQIAIAKVQGSGAADLMELTQPMIHEVLAHTDGKGTNHSPVAWFEGLSYCSPAKAASLLAHELSERDGVVDWRYESSLEALLIALSDTADPLILSALWPTLLPERVAPVIDARVRTLNRLTAVDGDPSHNFYRLLAAEIEGDGSSVDLAAFEKVQARIREVGTTVYSQGDVFGNNTTKRQSYLTPPPARFSGLPVPLLSAGGSPFNLLAELRKTSVSRDISIDALANALGYRLIELAQSSTDTTEVEILLKQIGKDTGLNSDIDVVYASLAEGFIRFGHPRLAALAYALAFTRSRGAGGWLSLGDEKHAHLFRSSLQLDHTVAYETLAEEVLSKIDGDSYEPGLTQHLITLFVNVNEVPTARAVWMGAFEVVDKRLPRTTDIYSPFDRCDASGADVTTLEATLCLLLLSRLVNPDQRKKRAALAGAAYLLRNKSDAFAAASRMFLEGDYSFTANLVLLGLIEKFEMPPYAISRALSGPLAKLASCAEFGLCEIARGLLLRCGASQTFAARARTTQSPRVLTEDEVGSVLSIDRTDRVRDLEELWPQFPSLMAASFQEDWDSNPRHKANMQRRIELVQEPGGRRYPSPPILLWHQELFEIVLHRRLNDLDAHLWRIGEPNPDLLKEVSDAVSPDVEMHVRYWLSRTPRPPLMLPSRQDETFVPLGPLNSPDDHAGWVRIAYYEREHILKTSSTMDGVYKTIGVSAGFEIPRPGDEAREISMPFGYGEVDSWRNATSALPLFRGGPLVGFALLLDYLGILPMLCLPPRLGQRLATRTSDPLTALEFSDSSGNPCVKFRQWHVRPLGDGLSSSAPRLFGCDLIVRAELWKEVCTLFASQGLRPRTYASDDES